jgi:hypothetical protein
VNAAPPWLISLIVHFTFLVLVGAAAVEVHRRQTEEMDVDLSAIDDSANELYSETVGQQLDQEQPAVDNPLAEHVDTGYSLSDLPPVDNPLAAPPLSPDPAAPGDGLFSAVEAPSIGWALSGREEGRKEALMRAYGGTKSTQESVDLALAWLAKQQRGDGLWSLRGPYANGSSSENQLAATAMALLAFLGDGHTHVKQSTFRRNVERGMRALIKQQQDTGEFYSNLAPTSHRLYTHAQCTIVMCELYGLTEDSLIRESAKKAVDYAVQIQSEEGGWRYLPYQDSDTSVTGWFVMALESARMAKLDVPEITFTRVGKYLDRVSSHQASRYRYQEGRSETLAMTAEALLCRQYLGWKRDDDRLQRGVTYLGRSPVNWDELNVYHWYYATQVMHHMGGQPWVAWNKVMRQEVPAHQVRTGKERGSWNPSGDAWAGSAGRLYMTCLSTYMLEVYYRHLPLYSPLENGPSSLADAGDPAPDERN